MRTQALHQGIQYTLEETGPGDWRWSFAPPHGPSRSGRVKGPSRYAATVARRAIEIWHLMHRNQHHEAA